MKPATPDSPITSPDSLYSLTGPTVTNRKKVQGKARPTIRLVRSFDFKLPTFPLVCGYNVERSCVCCAAVHVGWRDWLCVTYFQPTPNLWPARHFLKIGRAHV